MENPFASLKRNGRTFEFSRVLAISHVKENVRYPLEGPITQEKQEEKRRAAV